MNRIAKFLRDYALARFLIPAGIILMIADTLMLLIFVPRWVWTGALSVVMISVGFLMWRFL